MHIYSYWAQFFYNSIYGRYAAHVQFGSSFLMDYTRTLHRILRDSSLPGICIFNYGSSMAAAKECRIAYARVAITSKQRF